MTELPFRRKRNAAVPAHPGVEHFCERLKFYRLAHAGSFVPGTTFSLISGKRLQRTSRSNDPDQTSETLFHSRWCRQAIFEMLHASSGGATGSGLHRRYHCRGSSLRQTPESSSLLRASIQFG